MHGTREMRRKQALQRGCDLDEPSKKTGAAAGQTGLHRRLPQVCVQGRGDPSCVRPGSSSGSCCHRRPGEQGVQGDRASRGSEPRRGTERTGGVGGEASRGPHGGAGCPEWQGRAGRAARKACPGRPCLHQPPQSWALEGVVGHPRLVTSRPLPASCPWSRCSARSKEPRR